MRDCLKGVRIVVTRSAGQAEEIAAPLREAAAEVVVLPALEIIPPADGEPLRANARAIRTFDWVIFTSANAVKAFSAELEIDPNAIGARVACVGAATAQAAVAQGFQIAVTPQRYVAESLLPCFSADMRGERVLIPRSALARDVIPDELRKRGAEVTVVEAYRNVTPEETVRAAPALFASPPDWVLFASSSAVDHIAGSVGAELLSRSRLGSIGPVTSATIRQLGLPVAVEADPHTVAGLVEAVKRCYVMMQEQ